MKTQSILLVEHEPVILKNLSRELIKGNFNLTVTVATNTKYAIASINNGYFDLVVTDLILPDLDGFKVLEAAKRLKNLHTKVIILTSHADVNLAIDALRLGVDDFFLKPCDMDDLVARIGNCLVKQELERKVVMQENVLSVCSYCDKIRADQLPEVGQGPWLSREEYFAQVNGMECSHGCCPECFEKVKPNFIDGKIQYWKDLARD